MDSGVTNSGSIVTIGLCPCWDITCYVEGADWGEHIVISSQTFAPAGKALNVSRALAWLGAESTAAGLWGKDDYQQLLKGIGPLSEFVRAEFTVVDGRTRSNVTIVDTVGGREMHLRAKSKLATREALSLLKQDLRGIVQEGSICVFAGAMPEDELLDDCLDIIKQCCAKGARVVVDSSGAALKQAVDAGGLWIIKPNLAELCELLGQSVSDEPKAIALAAGELLEKADIVLISRGDKGAVAVSRETVLEGTAKNNVGALGTVGCGDYLLAGFLGGLKATDDISSALEKGLKAAAAKAFGWTGELSWADAESRIEASVLTIG